MNRSTEGRRESGRQRQEGDHLVPAPFAGTIGQTRYVVLLAVGAVLLVAMALFALGAVMAAVAIWHAFEAILRGDLHSSSLTVEFLEIVSIMLKAVIFYMVGVGFYSLFIAPLNLPLALGLETLNDLESKVVSAIVVIMAVTFLEHFILWEQPSSVMPMGITLALVTLALVAFQWYTHWAKEEQLRSHAEP